MARPQPILNLPNVLTILRILAIPLIAWLLLTGDVFLRYIAFGVYVLAAVTDWLDGWLARNKGLGTPFGRMLDPIADKLLVGALILLFAFDGSFSPVELWLALAILLREIFVSGLREYLGGLGVVIHVSKLAKYKTAVQLVALGVVMAERLFPIPLIVGEVGMWLAAILTVVTGAEYLVRSLPHFRTPPGGAPGGGGQA